MVAGVTICTGCDGYDHRRGASEEHDGQAVVVHWAPRGRVERAGLRAFLQLAARGHLGPMEPWQRLYRSQALIQRWARELGVSFPGHLLEADKLTLKAMLINVPAGEERDAALAWARG